MNIQDVRVGSVLVSKGNGERLKVKGFTVVEASPQDKTLYLTVKPYSPDALGNRTPYRITSWMAETYYDIERSEPREL